MAGVDITHRKREETCSIARAVEIVGDRWSLLILREAAMRDATRFADFRARLRIAPDVLVIRLRTLVDAGVMEKRPYHEPGARTRESYHLTPAGEQLRLILAALQQWGDDNRPLASGPTILRRSADDNRPVRVAFVDDTGAEVSPDDVRFHSAKTPAQA
ncbi:winged helix-turn-helix transcriptional regulator [Streptomyces brasiliensis]|uniref:HxlR family transcriptional regulator n=1 Tax=Streptomyces brasiliensis TaxID=1954 RepID=A0A917PBP1_9ACTN|nr:helix-turn-helix domain-containing protein [Streptomyces brasiliensis]GGJ69640.1 HxlR family transcriptional regulator [Streptomyces brasiliensis]